jgi:hypothetical protein
MPIGILLLFDGYPYSLVASFGFGYLLLQAVKPYSAVNHFSYYIVLAYQYASFGVGGCVARMYAYAAKHGHS